jgi:hypothetical protein
MIRKLTSSVFNKQQTTNVLKYFSGGHGEAPTKLQKVE